MKVLIGIQARSGSTRLPRKAFELISGRMMLDRVIDACTAAATSIERKGRKCVVAVLTPEGDPIAKEFGPRIPVVEGPEHDVLGRYALAMARYEPDLLVRVTGDCPLIPPPLIAYITDLAITNGYDYMSNVDERFRTSIDGSDCEVISSRIFDVLADHARTPYDREHVTPYIRKSPPEWARIGVVINHFDLSTIKLSVDTQEDLERVRSEWESRFQKYQEAAAVYGRGGVHRL